MYRRMKYLYTIVFASLFVISLSFVKAQDNILQQVGQSIIKIETSGSSASGFIWYDYKHAVTALHVVDGQNRITVSYVNANGYIVASSPAVVEKVLKESDLVLLRISSPQQRTPLLINPTPLVLKQSLDAVGFPLNIAGCSSTEVKVRFGGNQLRSILPPKVLNKIRDYPSITSEILNLEGNLVPGLSGAPIVDNNGRVVGVVDGGLEAGAIGICWGIPASVLHRLSQSNINQTPGSATIDELFSVDLQANVTHNQNIGNLSLIKLRSRSFQQLVSTADDQLGLTQLALLFTMFNPYSFRYDIFQDLVSGAIVVVPEGSVLYQSGNFIVADMGDPRMELKFQINRTINQKEAQNLSLLFEEQLTGIDNFSQVIVDPQWSYLLPVTSFGVMINRKGIYRNTFNNYVPQTDKYYFETLAYNGNTLLAVAAVNNDNTPQTLQMEMLCGQGYNYQDCPQIIRSRQLWAQYVLGVQLASFPQIQL